MKIQKKNTNMQKKIQNYKKKNICRVEIGLIIENHR